MGPLRRIAITGHDRAQRAAPGSTKERGMRQRLALIVAALALVAAPSTALAVDPTQPAYGGPLTGAQEVPAVTTTATGQGTAVISADGSTITYIVTYSGLSGTVNASSPHRRGRRRGGVILPLTAGPSPMVGTLTAANFAAAGSVTTFAQAVAAVRAGDDLLQPPHDRPPGRRGPRPDRGRR